MKQMQEVLAIAHTVEPAAVKALLANAAEEPHEGAIFITIPEDGMTDLIYCRYGLGIPYYKVQVDEKLWVKPTIGYSERWVYTGLADVGGATLPDEAMVLGNELRTYITDLVGEINDEAIAKLNDIVSDFNSHITTYNGHTHIVAAVMPGPAAIPSNPTLASGSSSTVNAVDTTDASDDILSDVIFGKKQ